MSENLVADMLFAIPLTVGGSDIAEGWRYMDNSCRGCVNLWKEYAIAAIQLSRLDARARLASLRGAHHAVNSLLVALQRFEHSQARLRQRIIEHHAHVHDSTPLRRARNKRR